MKTFKTLLLAVTLIAVAPMTAQTADEILSNYFENTGGEAAWNALEGAKMIGSVSAQGMDIPVEMYQMKDGKQLLKINNFTLIINLVPKILQLYSAMANSLWK